MKPPSRPRPASGRVPPMAPRPPARAARPKRQELPGNTHQPADSEHEPDIESQPARVGGEELAPKPNGVDSGELAVGGDSEQVVASTPVRSVVSTGLQARLAERAQFERARRKRRWWWIALVTLVLGLTTWLVFFSALFALDADRVSIRGTADTVDRKAVLKLVEDNYGVPLPRLNTTALRLKIKDVRGVQDVTLRRDWPRGLTVSIVARQPVAAVPDEDKGDYVLLDSQAVQVGRAAKAPDDIPVVDIPVGEDNQPILESVLVVLEAIPEKLSSDVRRISASTQDDITLLLRGGGQVMWGDKSNNALKASVLDVLRKKVDKVKNFDVSAPSAPITW